MINVACPEWTEYRKKNGLDPLGMQNTSVALYQKLLPGVSNVTLRVRYYGLYAWLSSVYARQIRETNLKTWQRFVRRAEALYALIAQQRGGEAGVRESFGRKESSAPRVQTRSLSPTTPNPAARPTT
jgi:hypothetical protein